VHIRITFRLTSALRAVALPTRRTATTVIDRNCDVTTRCDRAVLTSIPRQMQQLRPHRVNLHLLKTHPEAIAVVAAISTRTGHDLYAIRVGMKRPRGRQQRRAALTCRMQLDSDDMRTSNSVLSTDSTYRQSICATPEVRLSAARNTTVTSTGAGGACQQQIACCRCSTEMTTPATPFAGPTPRVEHATCRIHSGDAPQPTATSRNAQALVAAASAELEVTGAADAHASDATVTPP
jgi:hypothetical protein